eukprot:symbB.v1.2.029900.t1/scaffold3318.1/size84623/9
MDSEQDSPAAMVHDCLAAARKATEGDGATRKRMRSKSRRVVSLAGRFCRTCSNIWSCNPCGRNCRKCILHLHVLERGLRKVRQLERWTRLMKRLAKSC